MGNAQPALLVSVMVTLLALVAFGYLKGRFTGAPPIQSALKTALVGGLAAAAAFVIERRLGQIKPPQCAQSHWS